MVMPISSRASIVTKDYIGLDHIVKQHFHRQSTQYERLSA